MNKELLGLSLVAARQQLQQRAISARELTRAYLDAITDRGDQTRAYITITEQGALAAADAADRKLAAADAADRKLAAADAADRKLAAADAADRKLAAADAADRKLAAADAADKKFAAGDNDAAIGADSLLGLPLAIKDLFCTKDILTTAGSRMLANFIPPYESTVTERLWQAGAVCLGKTNMDEFAMGSATTSSFFGATTNPWSNDKTGALTAGGSSGGSAAAVAGLLAPAALGSDTGGSIRQPCAFTGLVGVKPTYGRCSRYGMVSFASSLDQAGVMTRDVADAALLLSVMAGYDNRDSTSANLPVPRAAWQQAVAKGRAEGKDGLQTLKIATASWRNNQLVIEQDGKVVGQQLTQLFNQGLETYYIIAPAEASSNLSRYDGVRYGFRASNNGRTSGQCQRRVKCHVRTNAA